MLNRHRLLSRRSACAAPCAPEVVRRFPPKGGTKSQENDANIHENTLGEDDKNHIPRNIFKAGAIADLAGCTVGI